MDLSPYLEALRRDLAASATPGGPDLERTAQLLAGSLEAATRLCLMEALSDAAAEITTQLDSASVEVRLRGRDAEFVVTELTPVDEAPTPTSPPPPPTSADPGDIARITLRLPEPLKESVERAAAAEGISVNAWLVRAIGTVVHNSPGAARTHRQSGRASFGRRMTGYAQA